MGLIAMCTPDLLFQRFQMDEQILLEYEEKWLARVEKFYSTKQ